MTDFAKKVYSTIEKYSMLSHGEQVVVGLSGGADSVALVSVLKSLGYKVCAVHINHMLRGEESNRDEKFVSEFCKNNEIELFTFRVDVSSVASLNHISEEVAGRNVRYEHFKKVSDLKGIVKIAVAHNKNDNFETMIFNMARGTALKGISGIAPVNESIIRPLIDCDRTEIEDYINRSGFSFVNDSTNFENIYSRNIIRNQVIPYISKINSNCISNAKRCSDILREEDNFLDSITEHFMQANVSFSPEEVKLHLSDKTDPVILRRAICKCIAYVTVDNVPISCSYIENILNLSSNGKQFFVGDKLCVSRSYDSLIFSAKKKKSSDYEYKITNFDDLIITETNEKISFDIVPVEEFNKRNAKKTYLDADKVGDIIIRNRRAGDRFTPSGMKGTKKLKDYFIDNKIASHERNMVPLFISDGEIACIMGMRVSEKYKIDSSTKKILCISKSSL